MPVFSSVIESSLLFTSFRSLVAVAWGARGGGGRLGRFGAEGKKEGRRKEVEIMKQKKEVSVLSHCFLFLFSFLFFFSTCSSSFAPFLPTKKQTMDAADLSATVRDFLSAFVTEVLAVRGLYSPELFDRRRVLGFVAARRARHPGLAAYIDSAVGGMVVSFVLSWRAGSCEEKGVGGGKGGERGEGEEGEQSIAWGESAASSAVVEELSTASSLETAALALSEPLSSPVEATIKFR